MCGIMGYIGTKPCVDLLYAGLKKLEYRGYDSSGIAVVDQSQINLIKSEGKLSRLEPLLASLPQQATIGMGHTRWATHGRPNTINAHPHSSHGVAIVHNGIFENFQEFKIQLLEKGYHFTSETDTEVLVHLFHDEMKFAHDPKKAILNITRRLRGAFAFALMLAEDPHSLYVVKQGSPLVIGVGDGCYFLASDAYAFSEHTSKVVFLEDGLFAHITKDHAEYCNFHGVPVEKSYVTLEQSKQTHEKDGFRHFMLKEIHEQPRIFSELVQKVYDADTDKLSLDRYKMSNISCKEIEKITIIGCGTAYYAGLLGQYIIEQYTDLPVKVELASEFRSRTFNLDKKTLIIAMTQSGETLDTLSSVKKARQMGASVLTICNAPYASIPRESTETIYMECGQEVGVASTKAFTAMVLNLLFVAVSLAKKRTGKFPEDFDPQELLHLAAGAYETLSHNYAIEKTAENFVETAHMLYMGRGFSFPIALEGALKIKEISYIHAEGYAGGELKHGPIALVDSSLPIVALAPKDSYYEKMISNIEEVAAREGKIIGVGAEDDTRFKDLCTHYLPSPQFKNPVLQAISSVIPLQLFAYYVSIHRGTDVDQPRNLAKSVTVE